MLMRCSSLFLLITLCVISLLAQPDSLNESWRWAHFTRESGLPSNSIYEIYESSDGVIWVSTPLGLGVFDGFRWYAIGNGRYTIDGDIRGSVLVRKQDSLFSVTKGADIHYLLDGISKAVPRSSDSIFLFRKSKLFLSSLEGGEIVQYREIDAPSGIATLHGSRSGVFAEAGNTLYRLSHGTWRTMLSSPAGELVVGTGSGDEVQLLENSDGTGVLCVLRPHQIQGVWEWSNNNPLKLASSEKPEYLRAMAIGPRGQVIAVYRSDDVRLRSKGVWRTINLESLGIKDVLSVYFLSNGDVCVGTKQGLYHYTVSPSRWVPFRNAVPDFTKKLNFTFPKGRACFGDLLEASNGKLYALVARGASSDLGALIEYDPLTNSYINKIDLNPTIGSHPYGSLMQASDGRIYGMTWTGGASNLGVIFRYDISTNTYSMMADFTGPNGANPQYCRLIEIEDLASTRVGSLWGMTNKGGVNDMGTLFSFDPVTSTITKKVDFSARLGSRPVSSLLQASNGKLYGMTSKGGTNDLGVIFEYDIENNAYRKKIDLSAANGSNPNGALMQASNGLLYGMTNFGGANNAGVIFEYDISSNTYTKKYDFDPATGGNPSGSLMQASNGLLYGTTSVGGVSDIGTLFEFTIGTNTYTKGADFRNDGFYPYGSLIEVGIGKLYGTTYAGNNTGMIFEYDINTTNPRKSVNEILLAKDGTLWIATGNGLEIKYADGAPKYIDRIGTVKIGTVTGLGEDNNGNIWISGGSAYSGVFCWDGKQWKHVTIGDSTAIVVIDKIRKDNNGNLWFLGMSMSPQLNSKSQPGVFLLRDGKFFRWGEHEGFTGGRVYAFAEGSDGARWFGTTGGISRWRTGLKKNDNPETGVWSNWPDTITFQGGKATIHAMALDRSNRLWFAARGTQHMLGYIDAEDSVRTISTSEFVYKYIFDLRVDDEGLLWLATDVGLYLYKDNHFIKFDVNSGLSHNELFSILSVHHTMYLGIQDNGVVGFDKSIPLSPPPRVVIDKPLVEDRHAQIRWTAYTYKGEVPPSKVFSRYSLNGGVWSEWEKKSNISFNNLEPGTFTLRVQSRGLFQQYDSAGVNTSFTIHPPLYLRPVVFYPGAIALTGIISLIGILIWRKRKYDLSIRVSEERYRMITELMSDYAYFGSIDDQNELHLVWLTDSFTRITGFTVDEAKTDGFLKHIVYQDDLPAIETHTTQLISGNASETEVRIVTKNKEIRWMRNYTIPVVDKTINKVTHIYGIARDITRRKHNEEQLRQLAGELSRTEEQERRRMATFLHDTVSQSLLISKRKLEALRESKDISQSFEKSLTDVLTYLQNSIEDTRTLTFELCPPILYDLGLSPAIDWLAEQMKEAHDIGVTFIDDGNPKPLSDELRNMLYTGARELLMNTVKHAGARHVWIDLSRRNGEVLLAVEDDGIGFDVIPQYRDKEHPGSGFGLVNLRERLKHLGGRVEIESTKGKGTRITITVPVTESVTSQ